MAECCRERHRHEGRRAAGRLIRGDIRRAMRVGMNGLLKLKELAYCAGQSRDEGNPPDERRAWGELVKELEAMAL